VSVSIYSARLCLTPSQADRLRIEKAKVSESSFDGSGRCMLKETGWRGGFILSALESYIKLDLTKHFKVCPRRSGIAAELTRFRSFGIWISYPSFCRAIGAVSFSSDLVAI
jgi:hypothetical protein